MVILSISINSIPKKQHYISAHNIAYISATFSNDSETREFVEKISACFKCQNIAVLIEGSISYRYKKFFHNSNMLELDNAIIALDVDGDDLINIISNWCYYETGVSLYVTKDKYPLFSDKCYHNHRFKKKLINYLQQNSVVIISQELDYTVNIQCKKEVFDPILAIVKDEKFSVKTY